MSALESFVAKSPRERGGPLATNRFEYQMNWAFCHLLELHKSDQEYLMVLDYHDDVVVFNSSTAPTSIQFFQVKSRGQSKGAWKLKELTHRSKSKDESRPDSLSIMGKLYAHHVDFGLLVGAVIFVSNAQYAVRLQGDKDTSTQEGFSLDDIHIDEVKRISSQLQEEHSLGHCPIRELGITFRKDSLSLEDQTAHAKGRFAEFASEFLGIDNCPVSHAYNAIIQAMRVKQNWEPNANSPAELIAKKGFSQNEFAAAISKLRRHSASKSWATFEATLVQEDVDVLTLRRMRDAWDRLGVQGLDSTNYVLYSTKHIVFEAVTNRLRTESPKPLVQFIDRVSADVRPQIEGKRLPFDQTAISAMILTVLDEYPTE
ncbi:MAG: DUF4297 domain-containing protein [Chthoniobacteraceae bacterium]